MRMPHTKVSNEEKVYSAIAIFALILIVASIIGLVAYFLYKFLGVRPDLYNY